jgi:hypothetical protein
MPNASGNRSPIKAAARNPIRDFGDPGQKYPSAAEFANPAQRLIAGTQR